METGATAAAAAPEKSRRTDYELLFLQTVGILAVVLGHYSSITTALNGVFPYYSWHMPFFIFLSGILFSRKTKERGFLQTVKVKITRLLLPALLVNLCYGVICTAMRRTGLVPYGKSISLQTLFIDPFLGGAQFEIDVSLWFIFQLFVIEMIFNAVIRIPGKKTDIAVTALALAVSVFCVYRRITGPGQSGIRFLLIRTGFLAFFFALGITYDRHIRPAVQKLKRPMLWGAAAVAVQCALLCATGINPYFNTRSMSSFDNYPAWGCFLPQVFACLCTAFLVLLARAIHEPLEKSRALRFIGSNLKAVVYHHQMVGVLLNCTAVILSGIGLKALVPSFDLASFQAKRWYAFAWGRASVGKLMYLVLPFLVPILYNRLVKKSKDKRVQWLIRLAAFLAVTGYVLVAGLVLRWSN